MPALHGTCSSAGIAGALPALRVVAVGMLAVVAAELLLAAVFGTGDTDAGFVIELLVTGSLVALTPGAVLVLDPPLALVWALLPVASLLGLAAAALWLRSGRWRRMAV